MSFKHAALAQQQGKTPHSPFEAFRLVAYRFGVPALAAEMGTKPGTLYNKCDADDDTHHQPTLRDVVLATRVTGDTTILDSLCRMFGLATYALSAEPVSDVALLELLCKVGGENGEMHKALMTALADAKFTTADLRLVRAEAYDLITAVLNLVQRLEGLVDD
jgi:hypothetical protein